MEEEKRYFYQPDLTTAIIDWSWTFLILVVGIIIGFEYTHFNWITGILVAIFIVIAGLSIFSRTVKVTPSKLVFSRVLVHNYMSIPMKDIRQPVFTKHTMTITINGEVMTFSFGHRSLVSIQHFMEHSLNKQKD